MMTAATEATLAERVELLEKQLTQLVEGLRDDVVGMVSPTIASIDWDPSHDW